MSTITTAFSELSQRLQGPPCEVIVTFSGGVDSRFLLYMVTELRQQHPQHQYRAFHVNHGLSEYAQDWQLHCEKVCTELAIPFDAVEVHIDKNDPRGVEAAARDARYLAFRSTASHGSLVLLGQHADDQLETFLLQLTRGAGPKGLSSMPGSYTDANGIDFLRPLLWVSQKDIEQQALALGLNWIEDDSNQDIRFDRNFLRHKIVPELIGRWPSLSQSVARSALLCAQQQQMLDEICEQKLSVLQVDHMGIGITGLSELSINWQHQLIRYWLQLQNVALPSYAVMQQLSSLLHAKADANPIIQLAQGQLRRHRGSLYYVRDYPVVDDNLHLPFDKSTIELPEQLGSLTLKAQHDIRAPELVVKVVPFSTRFKPALERHSKPLKQWFKQWQVPTWLREQSVQVVYQHELVAVLIQNQLVFSADAPESLPECLIFHPHVNVL